MTREPDRRQSIALIDLARRNGARASLACAELGIHLRTYQRWTQGGSLRTDGRSLPLRPPPSNRLSDAERQEILMVCNRPEHSSMPPSQIVPKLADEGTYIASESSFYRVLRAASQLHRRGRAKLPRKSTPPKSHRATAPNQVWSWDITYLNSCINGLFFRLYLILDIYSRKIVAWEIHETESSEHASTLISKACLSEGVHHTQLVLHSDNGSPMKGSTMLSTLQRLGVTPSFSRPSVSNDNPYSESLFRTLKYAPSFPAKPFETITAARLWVQSFATWYNHSHRHSGLKFVSPAQRHLGDDLSILAHRHSVYLAAKLRHPERWTGPTRNWLPDLEVWLNPQHSLLDCLDLDISA